MKKVGIVVILIVCCLGLLFIFVGKQDKTIEAADCLPSDVLFYGEQLDFTSMYTDFLESRLGQVLAGIDYKGIAAELGEPGISLLTMEESWIKMRSVLDAPGFNELLGKEFSIAFFPATSFSADNPAKAIEERLLLIARPRHNVKMLQMLAPFLSRDIEQSSVQYGPHIITRYQIDEVNTLSAVSVEGLVIAGFEERLVRKSLDHYDTKKDTLSRNKDFMRLRKNFKGTEIFTYLSFPALLAQGRMIGEDLAEKERAEFFALLDEWDGWGAAAYGIWNEKTQVMDRTEILYDKSKLDSRIARLCEIKPGKNKTLQLVPDDSLFYYWTNTLNLPLIWELYSSRTTRQQPEAFDILRHELRDSAGVELEELLDMVDNEFAMIVDDVDREGIPLPKATMVVQLKKPVKFIEVFTILLRNADIPVSIKQYKKHDISFWGEAPQGGLQPAFTLIGNYLLISNSVDLIEKIVELRGDNAKGLISSAAMKEVGQGLLKENNSAAYIHIAKLANALKDLAVWGGSMAAIQGPELARSAEIMVNQLILPLLDGIAMYDQLGSRSVITKDSIVLESSTAIVQ
ncbi:hypothetical protein UWK_03215 [Desulfocapsa sulfexigens DSM 10523]|uniref:DUF3352 domain-containing protein n=1 Tax=Desulfocapsa sulfexigens (strain DSM 10523 / SB164P1) TaxID=1167006 RepID=M1PDS5_DESSD|nr:DUF3352 domain-containing protein [Desulfocapsa sulfexigens]AGF79742.1 hypothetical protein UWK_03215 [Desulfocapsa sulfexigens DSM 10523]